MLLHSIPKRQGYPAEQRRITPHALRKTHEVCGVTPLLIEERGGQTYVIAYCTAKNDYPLSIIP